MAESAGGDANGLFAALKGVAATLLASGKTRLELLSNEIQVEKLRAVELMITVLAMAFCFGFGIILVVALLLALFWEQRIAVLVLAGLAFFGAAAFLWGRFRQLSQRQDRLFSASIAELEQDLQQLKAMTGHESQDR
jgi:uncharacterized membrane protein YqjE